MAGALACPACPSGQLARQRDPLCLACGRAAQEVVSWPLWVFDSPLLRQALADLNLPAVPAIVRAACGLTQGDLAGVAGWSRSALSCYERGLRDGVFDIRTLLQFCDSVGMPRQSLLPLVFADPDAGLAAGSGGNGTGMDVDRREFSGLAVGAAVAAILPGAVAPPGVSSSHLRYWDACADALYVRDRVVGGTALLQPALDQWQRVRQAVRAPGRGGTGRQLLVTAGNLALCTGWIALDGGCVPLARSLYAEAGQLAASAGDTLLAVHALTNSSMLWAEMARTGPSREPARQALRLACEAAEEGRYLPVPRLHALIGLRHASAASLLGDKAGFGAAITRARRELDRGPRDDDAPQWLRFVSETEITGVEARGYLNLGEAGHSVLLYRRVLDDGGLSARNRASYGAGLADALLRQGARQDAVEAAMDALLAIEAGVTSIRCLNRLRLVRAAAGTTVGAEEFCARFDAAERGLAPAAGPIGEVRDARSDVPA